MWHTGLVALWHMGSSQTRARTHVPCIGRWILNHGATREVPASCFLKACQRRDVLKPEVSQGLKFKRLQMTPRRQAPLENREELAEPGWLSWGESGWLELSGRCPPCPGPASSPCPLSCLMLRPDVSCCVLPCIHCCLAFIANLLGHIPQPQLPSLGATAAAYFLGLL